MMVYIENEADAYEELLNFDYEAVLKRCVEEAVIKEGCPYEVEVNILLADNASIQEINLEFRKLDMPTDVLSFPMITYKTPADFSNLLEDSNFNMETGTLLLGDIMISIEKAAEQAEEYGHSFERELAFLTVHSMLHLFGYDHMEEEERLLMEERQRVILDCLGIQRVPDGGRASDI